MGGFKLKKYLAIGIILIIAILIGYSVNHIKYNIGTKTDSTAEAKSIKKNTQAIINEQTNGGNIFYFGMSRQEFYLEIKKLKTLKLENMGEITITSGPENWNYGNIAVWSDQLDFTFDKNDKLYQIAIKNDIPTTLGLKLGDNFNDMKEKYGGKYTSYQTPNDQIYEYMISDHYFRVYIEKVKNGKIEMWEISKYKYDKK